ncbi:ABC transporter substrate-binding protein [Pseudomonas sp. CCC3.1]|uniref:ABC transporter substrate-binding protein n=2 Tax=unclassified Pseudomonas TaxID=196821 RepID=UPI002AC99E0D|nr:ABC transporter substrate-binding protein [Pseudomonas sp. CCC3.1]MEB0208504.1 ABC transporter substrate-binding protein [Pseudomonas sp. CCC3.1]WPX38459.1 ABC transporter substrate-binding protein [Pseudomonas sp. CCC3.1]
MTLTRRQLLAYTSATAALLQLTPRFSYADDTPVRGGTLKLHIAIEPPILVNLTHTAGAAVYITGKVTEGLLNYDMDLKPLPQLATAWTVSEDGLAYTFSLRQDVKWHDGQDFSADDVVFSLNTLKNSNPRGRATFANVASITAINPHLVQLTLSKPAPYLLTALAACESPIVAKHVYGEARPETHPNASAPIGTGPFVFKEWVRGSHVILERNPNYWDAPKPYLDRIIVRFIADSAATVAALEAGEIDISTGGVPLSDIERIKINPRLSIEDRSEPYINGITRVEFNLDNPYLKQHAVRVAIAHAINLEFIRKTIFLGYGQPLYGPISPDMKNFYAHDLPRYAFDVAKANQLLDDAGLARDAQGVRFKLTLDPLPGPETYRRTADYIKQALAKIGIQVTLRSQDFATYVKRVYTDRDFDFTLNGMSNLFDPTVGVQRLYWSKNFQPGVPFSNGAHYNNPQVDQLLEAAAVETDVQKRFALFAEFQKTVVEDLPDLGISTLVNPIVYDKRVKQFFVGAQGLVSNAAEIFIAS